MNNEKRHNKNQRQGNQRVHFLFEREFGKCFPDCEKARCYVGIFLRVGL